MAFVSRAPGKLVILGEYAVLDGAPALAMAVDRYCRARIETSADALCHLLIRAPTPRRRTFAAGESSGVQLVDAVGAQAPNLEGLAAWHGELDSADLFIGPTKLGLGSSAAALCAWCGVWTAYLASLGFEAPPIDLARLIALHRAFQQGAGSGLDVAVAFSGGVINFRVESRSVHHVCSVRLPNSVGFAGIFAGRSASTPDLLARYRAWQAEQPEVAARFRRRLHGIAEAGCAAAQDDDGDSFLQAVGAYGRALEELGRLIEADIVTDEHRAIGERAERYAVTYKVSGAGGGDLGLAFSADPQALAAFKASIGDRFRVVDFELDRQGLVVEERAQ